MQILTFTTFEDVFPLVPDVPGIGTMQIWEGASDYYEEMYGTDLGL